MTTRHHPLPEFLFLSCPLYGHSPFQACSCFALHLDHSSRFPDSSHLVPLCLPFPFKVTWSMHTLCFHWLSSFPVGYSLSWSHLPSDRSLIPLMDVWQFLPLMSSSGFLPEFLV